MSNQAIPEELWLADFKSNAIYRIEESTRMIRKALDHLPESAFWWRPNPASNAVGHLLLHLCGNMRQYVVSGLGGAPDVRERAMEFEPEAKPTPEETWQKYLETVAEVTQSIRLARKEAYLKERTVQGFRMSGIGMVLHAVEHLSYHTGQIAYAVKAKQNQDLGFYQGVDLEQKNDKTC